VTFSSFAFEGKEKEEMMVYPEISKLVLDSVFEVHRELGPGLLELPYRNALFYALRSRDVAVEMEHPYSVMFKKDVVGEYFADLLVDDRVILEVKAVRSLEAVHEAQLMNYLRISGCRLGYLLNMAPVRFQYKRMLV
jgi:GxxExxY protein